MQPDTHAETQLQFKIRPISGKHEEGFSEPSSTTVAQLRDIAFKRFHISPAPGQRWLFKLANGVVLERDDQTLAQAGVKDKDLLIFGSEADILG